MCPFNPVIAFLNNHQTSAQSSANDRQASYYSELTITKQNLGFTPFFPFMPQKCISVEEVLKLSDNSKLGPEFSAPGAILKKSFSSKDYNPKTLI